MDDTKKILTLIKMSEVQIKEVVWLWYPYIAYGKITIIQGDPGEGKTTFILYLVALLSRGEKLPFVESIRTPINIIYQTAEDGLEDTIKPRLVKMGADCSKVLVIDDKNNELSMTDERIEQALQETGARLLVLDPIQAFLGAQVDMHRANEIRPVLKRLGALADKYNCAIVLIGHMNKTNGAKSTYRGLGSIDFQATARSVLVVGRLKDKPNIRIVAHDKSSLAPEGEAVAFEMSEEEGFKLLGHYDISVDDLLCGINQENKLMKAETLLEDVLANGSGLQSDLLKRANGMDISKRILDQAKKNLGVKSFKSGDKWYWQLND